MSGPPPGVNPTTMRIGLLGKPATGVAAPFCAPADAAKYSFFLAVPAIGGASLLELVQLFGEQDSTRPELLPILLGMLVSYLVGVISLRALIRLLAADRLHWFAWYCGTVGLLTVGWQLCV